MSGRSSVVAAATAFRVVSEYPQDWKSGTFRNQENRTIHYISAQAEGAVKGTVVFTPGYGNSVNYHYDAIRKWQERGYNVYAMDWIGQGLSDRENPDDVTDANDRIMTRHMIDLNTFVTQVVPKDPDRPLLLATHSMGGHIGMLYLKHFPNTFDGAVLAAPLLDLNTSILPRSAFKGLVTTATKLGLADNSLPDWRGLVNSVSAASQDIHNLCDDPAALTLTEKTQLRLEQLMRPVEIKLPTWGWIKRIYPELDQMRDDDYFKDIQTPILLIAGGKENLVSNKAIHFAAQELPHGRILELPDANHSIWNVSGKTSTRLWSVIDDFIGRDIPHYEGFSPARPSAPRDAAPPRYQPPFPANQLKLDFG